MLNGINLTSIQTLKDGQYPLQIYSLFLICYMLEVSDRLMEIFSM